MGKKEKSEEDKVPVIIKTPVDLQRLKLEKLMKNVHKPIVIPERPKDRSLPPPPDFVRNVMGSSAGAGSGEFHVYRHLRRKEYARQKYIQDKSEKEKLDDEYHDKIEMNRKAAEEKTAKKRAKRLKKKGKNKAKKPKAETAKQNTSQSEASDDDGSNSETESNKDSGDVKETATSEN